MKKQKNTNTKQKRVPKNSQKAKLVSPKERSIKKYGVASLIVFVLLLVVYTFYIRPNRYRWRSCPGDKFYEVCIPCKYNVHGIDISHHQGPINWRLLQTTQENDFPLHFIFVKATEGGDHLDTAFETNFYNSRKSGFIRGAYHFFIPRTEAKRQANFFTKTVKLQNGDLPPVLDVELVGGVSKDSLRHGVKIWLEEVEKFYGVKPILYTSYKFKQKYLNTTEFDEYPFWIAHYHVDSIRYNKRWDFWQHSDYGEVPGINHSVDMNVFNGGLDELKAITLSTLKE